MNGKATSAVPGDRNTSVMRFANYLVPPFFYVDPLKAENVSIIPAGYLIIGDAKIPRQTRPVSEKPTEWASLGSSETCREIF